MTDKYSHLLAPLKVGGVILKSRLCQSKSSPHFLQGPEEYPAANLTHHYSSIARNGAAYVTVNPVNFKPVDRGEKPAADMVHAIEFCVENPACENYVCMCVDQIHFYNSLACVSLNAESPKGYFISAVESSEGFPEEIFSHLIHGQTLPLKEMTREMIAEIAEDMARKALYYKSLGFDMVDLYAPYTSGLLAGSLSPRVNHRTDEYGGSAANRFRFIGDIATAIKRACGPDFLVEVHLSCDEHLIDGFTAEDVVEFAKAAEGKVDIFQIRGYDGNGAHPTGFNSKEGADPMSLRTCEMVKKSGARVVVAGNGGYQDLDAIERYIAEGKMDMASMARAFICDFDYYKKAQEGRGDDVTPCIRCNKCHVPSLKGNWYSLCSVNPRMGIDNPLVNMIDAQSQSQKVAVIGGGPAGMRAALFAKARGHEVTLFEKTDYLGGQLVHADFAEFKWPIRRYKDWLVYQLKKQGVLVRMNTCPDPEMIRAEGFQAVIAATGAVAKMPAIEGADGKGIWTPISVYGRESELGKRVVIVGGAETGTETGIYLAECGHDVTVLSRKDRLAEDATPIHYIESFRERWEALDNFHSILHARTTRVAPTGIEYVGDDGQTHTLRADSVVVCGGVRPLQEEALSYALPGVKFFVIGDAKKPGNLHYCNRSAFAAACSI